MKASSSFVNGTKSGNLRSGHIEQGVACMEQFSLAMSKINARTGNPDHGPPVQAIFGGLDGVAAEAGVNIVMVRDMIVAEDLVQTLRDLFPQFEAVAVRDLCHLAHALDSLRRIGVAVIEMSPADFRHSPFLAALRARGARVVLLWTTEGEAVDGEFALLEKPFTTKSLVALLRSEPGP
jgi:hypothetical protein